MLEGRRRPTALMVIVVTLLAYGCLIQGIIHAFGGDERTVASWRDRADKPCQQVNQALVPSGQVDARHAQVDEIHVKGHQMIAWMGLALMAATRLWLAGVLSAHWDRRLADQLLPRGCKPCWCVPMGGSGPRELHTGVSRNSQRTAGWG